MRALKRKWKLYWTCKFHFLGVFLTSTHAPTKRPASRPLHRSHSALWTLTSAELLPKSNPVTDWHRQAGTRLSLGPRTHRARQPDKSACPALHLTENDYICRVRQIVIQPLNTMGSFWNKTKVFFKSRGWRIFWSLFVIAVFVNLFVQTLHRPMDWFRVVLLITLPILVIRRVFEIVQAIKSKTKDQ